jgi:uncharacterized OB-fold protein
MSDRPLGPGPVARNEATEAFFDGTGKGEFLLLRCRPSGHSSSPRATRCEICGSTELEPVPAAGGARLVSWAVVHDREGGIRVPAIVELDEGPWWWTIVVDADPDTLLENQSLRVRFECPEGSEAVPVFAPA